MTNTYYCPKCMATYYSATLLSDHKCQKCGKITIMNVEKEVIRHLTEEFKPIVEDFNKTKEDSNETKSNS